MKVILDNDDLVRAVNILIDTMGIDTTGANVDVKITRGGKGHMATVEITEAVSKEPIQLDLVESLEEPVVDVLVTEEEATTDESPIVTPDFSDDQAMFT